MKFSDYLFACFLVGIFALPMSAADIQNEAETILRDFGKASEKLDREHQRSTEMARGLAIGKLQRLAERAYREGDRTTETTVWKIVISTDPENERARKYFTDLGTLEAVLKDAPEPSKKNSATTKSLIGKWKSRFNNEKTADFKVNANGTVTYAFQGNQPAELQLQIRDSMMFLPVPKDNVMERWTVAGDRLLIEQWFPLKSFDASKPPTGFGYAIRIDK